MKNTFSVEWKTDIFRNIAWNDLEAAQQAKIQQVHLNSQQGFLLLSEPRPTLTFGRSALPSDKLWTEEALRSQGIDIQPVSRGGKWTYHGPGQLLLYPVAQLRSLGFDRRAVRDFLIAFRSAVNAFLGDLNLQPEDIPDKPFGIYVSGMKLVSFGIAISNGICSHGMALYLTDQRSFFRSINPCGVPGERIGSLEQLGITMSWEDAAKRLSYQVKNCFN